ncbi:MAG: hypothetical protein OXR62_07400 [Ahrensia sp.]|nr:hypothetical protein [Ahrensia sp.]
MIGTKLDPADYFGLRAVKVQAVIYGVLKIEWSDGFTGLVDLRSKISEGSLFEWLRDDPRRFSDVEIGANGQCVGWRLQEIGQEIDFGADSLRLRSERQAALLEIAN